MCLPKAPKDNSAEIARQAEVERQQKITEGRSAIDQQFAAFDPAYYQGLSDSYSGYYMPQLDDQFAKAKKALIFNLARGGNLNASAGAQSLAELTGAYKKNQAVIGDQAQSAAQQQRGQVENNKSELYNQLSASADPKAAATTAAARASSLTAPQGYSPLGDLFASFLNPVSTAIAYERNGFPGTGTGLFAPKKRGSEARVT